MPYEHDQDFPKKLFVTIPEPGDDGYPNTYTSVQDIDEDGATVAQYELVKIGTLSVSKRLGKLQEAEEETE